MKLLIFEYATAIGIKNPTITLEGHCMLESLLNDLKTSNANYLIHENSRVQNNFNGCNPIILDKELSSWLDENIAGFDACLPVAPEEDHILYEITKTLEEKGVDIIGSSSDAVLACSDKFETYNLLKDSFPMIKCEKVFFSAIKNYKKLFAHGKKMLVKPADGVSCSGVRIVQSYADFIKASAHLKRTTKLTFFLLQDYVEGISTSVSILSNGKETMPLSLNLQNIGLDNGRLYYNGGKVPYEHELSGEAKYMAKKVVESVDGLKGYVGVDLLLAESDDEIYVLEINPRLTTSYIALRRILNFNLGNAIVDAVYGTLPPEVEFNGSSSFLKEDEIIFK